MSYFQGLTLAGIVLMFCANETHGIVFGVIVTALGVFKILREEVGK